MVFKANDNRYDNMKVRRAGTTGLQLPALSFGMWHSFGDDANFEDSEKVMLHAFNKGIFSFDLANNYGPGSGAAERMFGQVYRRDLKPYRDELIITTKAGFHMWPGVYGNYSSKKTLVTALDQSLQRMGLDYVDIYYTHRFDPNTRLEETAEALDGLVRAGKALYIGISNYDGHQTAEMIKLFKELKTPFVVNQSSYNMLNREPEDDGTLKTLADNHDGFIAYGPLAEGLLTSKYLKGIPEDIKLHKTNKFILANGDESAVNKLNKLNGIAKNRDQTLAQMSLAWLLHDPTVASVVTGASKVDHLDDNLKALDNLDFTQDELDEIDKIVKYK
ncbi:aldo/keto reductase [Fructilactobacillus fructivorans]|uniref:Aldo/keto reductase n=1 Tax=Fructilactobacillus fructivorans TaxID=1614 RepID=A0A0C1LX96_9LACO|nr:aldo/keto reductase [Fructilactobacillus fructivorans]KID41285.1 Oxidoreductase [Fructilactobacillus fructivorans]KRK58804.1 NADP-dependent oxidoreductase domain-containing protein [Fructilactobacillus fructivorans]KRN13715.1 NADP-dependent oxidoreductase domain-containing protein [Fructilactobacillus fructivorans]KRN39583.1 NADP-dependent oxidoreductase domain-containing protein [Fructilactobacillus fructivorans]KRN43302.1 NADP-dependent oxidoreductase domain-containing protein [Fructilact